MTNLRRSRRTDPARPKENSPLEGVKCATRPQPLRRNSLEKMLAILDLFQGGALRWTSDEMTDHLRYSRSTLYRYLGALTNAGLLTSLPNIGYTLGPRITELDHELRSSDPLITNGRPILQTLVKEINGFGLLCRRYREHVLCVHQEPGVSGISSSYERGRAMPLMRGATSRVILAHLSGQQLRRIYGQLSGALSEEGYGRTLKEVQDNLRVIREDGYCRSRGEVTPGVTGIAAPIFDGMGSVIGSLTLTVRNDEVDSRSERSMIERVVFSARLLTDSMRTTGGR